MPHFLYSSKGRQGMGAKMSEKKEEIPSEQICSAEGYCTLTSVWSHHVGARAGKHHVPGVKLKSADGPLMLPVQHGHLHPTLSAPHVNSSVLGACGRKTHCLQHRWGGPKTTCRASLVMPTNHDKLRVRGETGLQGFTFTVVVALRDTEEDRKTALCEVMLIIHNIKTPRRVRAVAGTWGWHFKRNGWIRIEMSDLYGTLGSPCSHIHSWIPHVKISD